MATTMLLRVFDVEHGACSILAPFVDRNMGRIAMIDSGHNATTGWRPSTFIRHGLGRDRLDYLIITNADQDHLSDLDGFWDEGVAVSTLRRAKSVTAAQLRAIKEQQCELTRDIERFITIHQSYNNPVSEPFNQYMGGITISAFWNSYPRFTDTNNLGLVAFIKFGGRKFLFPGDMEEDGWLALLENDAFIAELRGTDILMASHHGRSNGFCEEIFDYFTPSAVVISDKAKEHTTQETWTDYRAVTQDSGLLVHTTGKRRHVLTTRRDGDIWFHVYQDGSIVVETECQG